VVVATGVLLGVAGCGDEAAAPSAEQRQRAQAAGFDVDLVYVIDVDGYHLAAGGSGVYGDAGYQAIYASSRGEDLRLTVERRSLDAGTCAALPVPGAEPPTAAVQCTREGDGWSRVAGDRREYAVARGARLVRVSGRTAATTPELIQSEALEARPATADELEALLPPASTVVEGGDVEGDNAPDNSVGAGG
jgi:hypothetical protein